ncbi:DUF1643 domain-containing protein [Kurthia sibirica]|uniref:DUF1643 domain-containing protein n=1 Tax=Kurthia sibirica TaxID=202750 RepID=A0A2U3AKG3_9BACL|nr:DUF1643 domain-containing protein [Kurthia sibirica]PWI25001.1 hypothetical protein DEX24_10530 [Kurthia sibirica]GEK33093.1 hypothetical protein KSI01_06260 [Kurthia sibirica]
MNYYFKEYVDSRSLNICPSDANELNHRYSIEIPFINRSSDNPVAYVVCKNPSKAGLIENNRVKSDKTANKLSKYFYERGYSKLVILNLASVYATDLGTYSHASIRDLVNVRENNQELRKQLSRFRPEIDTVAVGWGMKNKIKGSKVDYDQRIDEVLEIIKCYTEKIHKYPSELSYPIHPANSGGWNNEELVLF